MEIIAIILGSLALLAALLNTILILVEKKRNGKNHSALLDYVDSQRDVIWTSAEENAKQYTDIQLSGYAVNTEDRFFAIDKKISEMETQFSDAIKDIELDYRDAQNAANHINDFARGLSNIFDYDPLESARKSRDGREVE